MEWVQARQEDYRNRSRLERGIVAMELLQEWRRQTPMGRFLVVEEGTRPPLWKDVGDKKARAYISKQLQQPSQSEPCRQQQTQHLDDNGMATIAVNSSNGNQEDTTTTIEKSIVMDPVFQSPPNCFSDLIAQKLYDRDSQTLQLLEAFHRTTTTTTTTSPLYHQQQQVPSEMVLIQGPSGAGKTSLACSLKHPLQQQKRGYFLFGKFDQFRHHVNPYAAIFDPFETFVRLVLQQEQGSDDEVHRVRRALQTLGAELHLLMESMPYLAKILVPVKDESGVVQQPHNNINNVDEDTYMSAAAGQQSEKNMQNFTIAFRRFVGAIVDPEHPIVLVLDDLQWADDGSLSLLQSLLVMPTVTAAAAAAAASSSRRLDGLLVVGTCRGNEVSINHHLSVTLRSLEDCGVCITNIQVSSLSVGALAEMILDATSDTPDEQCQSLAEIVHSQTKGNAFFSVQYLQNLYEEGLLSGDTSTEHDNIIHQSLEDDSVRSYEYDKQMVKLLAAKMRQLPSEVQSVLKAAACLGNEFDESLLCHAGNVTSSTVLLALNVAEERGFIKYDFDAGRGRFKHDKFQEAAFSLIPAHETDIFQLQIGQNLRKHLPDKGFHDNLLLIASLITHGINEIKSEDEKEKTARLCLAAARKAARESAFSSAIEYIEAGISLLPQRHWRDQYDLSLRLYSTGAELAYCNADYTTVESLTKTIFEQARNLSDKIVAYTSHILSLDSNMKYKEAVSVCLDVLDQNGERFPRRVNNLTLLIDFLATRRLLRGKSADDIMNLPAMTDPKALASMSIIHIFYPIAMVGDYKYSPLTAFRLVRLTLCYGLSSMSKFTTRRGCFSLFRFCTNSSLVVNSICARRCGVWILRFRACPEWTNSKRLPVW